MRRFTATSPCPVCGGHERLARGRGTRCAGFFSTDGKAVYCERDDLAGGLKLHEHTSPPAFLHWLTGECGCGNRHDGQLAALPANNGHQAAATLPTRQRVASYTYQDADGGVAYVVDRFQPKDFRVRGGYRDERRFLYRLPGLLAADPGETVLLTEGEKDADRLAELGFVATTNANGAAGWTAGREQYQEQLCGRHVAILVDNDVAGRKRLALVAPDLLAAGCTVRVLDFPNLAEHGDVSDWLDAGHTVDELRTRAVAAPLWQSTELAPTDEVNGQVLMEGDEPALESLLVFLQPSIVIRGWSHIVAAAPKAGKTSLLGHVVRDWLDEGLRVLWLTEEPRSIWRRRLRRLGGDWSRLTLKWGDPSRDAELRERAATGPWDVVIVDTMRQFLKVEKWNDDALVAGAMRPWIAAVSRNADKTLLLVHHNRKGGGEHGEEIAGSHEILAAVDIALILKRIGDDESTRRRKLAVFGREIEGAVLLYEMADSDSRSLRYLGHPDAVSLAEVQARILEVLNSDWQGSEGIRAEFDEPKPSRRQVFDALVLLAEKHRIERDLPIGASIQGKRATWRQRP